ncbi:MAG: DNA polymerase IV [Dehalococcoidales bacterium]|nr:DNA polymerase IV [Dehalococcoidales bacterium]
MPHRIMHVDLGAFFTSVEQAENPQLRGKPVVVGGQPDRRGVVAAASYEARKFGIHSAMPLKTASRLCPHAIFISGDIKKYMDVALKFMAILMDFSPFIEPMGIDEAFLDVTGFESIHGTTRQMGEKIRQRVKKEIGINASVGIAGSKLVAKVASEKAKPDGLLEVPAGKDREFLSPLPIGEMPGIGKKTEHTLRKLGIDTIGKLAGMPLSTLKIYFGASGILLSRYSKGIDDSKVELPPEAKSISRETTFDSDTRDIALLEAALRYLSERVGSKLREKNKRAKCITLKLRSADFSTTTRRRTIGQATDADQIIFATGRELMKRELFIQKQLVRLIGIGVSHLTEAGSQLNMLDSTAARLEGLNKAVDKIRRKYGFTSIQTGRTMRLRDIFPEDERGYTLHTPSLSR